MGRIGRNGYSLSKQRDFLYIRILLSDMSTPRSSEGPLEGMCQPSSSVESSGGEEEVWDPGLLFPVVRPSFLAQRQLRLRTCQSHLYPRTRRKREMTPADKKDANYWDKRHKNNESAKRSQEKRRVNDLMLEGQLLALSEENARLRAELITLQHYIGLGKEAGPATLPSHGPVPLYRLLPGLSHSSVPTNLLMPWGSPCLPQPALYPSLPLYLPHWRSVRGRNRSSTYTEASGAGSTHLLSSEGTSVQTAAS
ncbi:thyrotroph embryonic factor-like [Coregonus clupeaformis]|uniref:thyrotroph embryonic factor-like n=1 Tax=Coregonus clupeaformis TaxID=59861 RepID=UPI001BDF91DC|nr:thyrotroph embryonic factor-like [Coregonus clupeaformis]